MYFIHELMALMVLPTSALPLKSENTSITYPTRVFDTLIGVSLMVITAQIILYVRQLRVVRLSHQMSGIFFATFALFCGIWHIIDAAIPNEHDWGVIVFRLFTATLSILAAMSTFTLVPHALNTIQRRGVIEASLEDEMDFRAAVLENSPHLMIAVSLSGSIKIVNRVAMNKLWPSAQIGGSLEGRDVKCIFASLNDDDRYNTAESLLRKLNDQREPNYSLVNDKGEMFPVALTVTEISSKSGVAGYLISAVDTTATKSLQNLMERAEIQAGHDRNNLFHLIQMAPASMAAFDRNMYYIEASPRWKDEMGIDSLTSLKFSDTVTTKEEWSDCIHRCISDDVCAQQSGPITITKTGKTTHVHWAISPWYIDNYETQESGVVMVIEIVQDLVLAREAALSASEQKSSFLANMSHELRTPLNGIIGFTDILIKELSSASEQDGHAVIGSENYDLIQSIKDSGESLLTLVNDILDFSKIEAGKMDIDPRPFSLRNCLQNICNLFEYDIRKKNLTLTTVIQETTIDLIYADDSRLRQILLNLLSNALKFTNSGSIILTIIPDSSVEHLIGFDVTDTGIGIASDRIPTLFRSFVQAGASTSRSYGGTGLGLAISMKLAVMMGGRMWVESVFGKGSTFSFNVQLPPAKISFSNSDILFYTGKKSEISPQELTFLRIPLKILAAEDNPINSKLLNALLKRMGYEKSTFVVNGQQAVDMVFEADTNGVPYDVVLMDLQMPVLSGFDATRKIRENDNIQQPKIIAVTAAVMREELEEAKTVGMDGHVCKPLSSRAIQDIFIKLFTTGGRALTIDETQSSHCRF